MLYTFSLSKKKNIKLRKINKGKRKILVFKYIIIYIRVKIFILFSLIKLKRIITFIFLTYSINNIFK